MCGVYWGRWADKPSVGCDVTTSSVVAILYLFHTDRNVFL